MGPPWELQVLRSGGSSLVSAAVSPIAQHPTHPAEQRLSTLLRLQQSSEGAPSLQRK